MAANSNLTKSTAVHPRQLRGEVISDKMMKTRVIAVGRMKRHPKYLKFYRVTTTFKAHDENNEYHVGDQVVIESTRPMSKEKRWKIVQKITDEQTRTTNEQ